MKRKLGGNKMNWKQEAVRDLQNYQKRKEALKNMRQAIHLLDDDYCSIKGVSVDSVSVQGNTGGTEEWMLNNIIKRERLKTNIAATEAWLTLIENGLRALTDQQRDILTEFYIIRNSGHVERLMERYHMEKTKVYEQKNQALYDFTLLMYGVTDY